MASHARNPELRFGRLGITTPLRSDILRDSANRTLVLDRDRLIEALAVAERYGNQKFFACSSVSRDLSVIALASSTAMGWRQSRI